jgi:DNA-binding transcriptional ArsR family regulator
MRHSRSIPEQPGGAGGGDFGEAARVLSYLADETRLRVLATLAGGEQNVGAICERLNRLQPSVSHHLALLRHTGILSARRQGKEVYYSISAPHRVGQNGVTVSLRGVTLTIDLSRPAAGGARAS